jgi:hypothetical protein
MKTPPYHANGARYCTGLNGERICTGSQMGRPNSIPADAATVARLHLRRVRPCGGGDYDKGGAYWGGLYASPLFCAWGESDTEQVAFYVRSPNRKAAKLAALTHFPNAKFYS